MKHNWEYKQLGEIGVILTGSTPSTSVKEYYDQSDYMFVKPGDIEESEITYLKASETYISELAFNTASRKLPKHSILVTCIGTIGKVGILQQEATCNQQINAIIPAADNIYYKYLAYAISSIKSFLISKKNGPVVPIINKTQFSKFKIPVPPMEVQEQIVAELDKINETIEDCRELLRNLDALAQSLFYDFFGDPNINPKGWEMRKFVDLCKTFTDGDWIESKDQSSDGFRLIQTGNIGEGIYLDKSERSKFISADTFYSLKCKEVFEGDILISRLPDPIGRACILPKLPLRSITAVDCTIVRPKSCILPKFLLQYTLTDAYYNSLSSITKGATRKRVSRGNLGKVLIPVPPLELQEKFAARIEQIEEQKKAVEQTIAELQTLLDSRMDYWFN